MDIWISNLFDLFDVQVVRWVWTHFFLVFGADFVNLICEIQGGG